MVCEISHSVWNSDTMFFGRPLDVLWYWFAYGSITNCAIVDHNVWGHLLTTRMRITLNMWFYEKIKLSTFHFRSNVVE